MKAMPQGVIRPWHTVQTQNPLPQRRVGPEPPQEEYQHFHIAAACQPLLQLKTISIVQFDCLNQTDLQQIHLSFDKSITVSFH